MMKFYQVKSTICRFPSARQIGVEHFPDDPRTLAAHRQNLHGRHSGLRLAADSSSSGIFSVFTVEYHSIPESLLPVLQCSAGSNEK